MKKNSNILETFGSYIRTLRVKNNIGQRELAKKIGIAPSYLNDIKDIEDEKFQEVTDYIEYLKKNPS